MHHHKFGHGIGQGGGGSGDLAVHDCPLCQSEAAAAASGGTIGGSPSTRTPNFMTTTSTTNNNNLLSTPLKLPAISSGDVAASMGSAALSLNESSGGRLLLNEADIYGGYPMKFLVMVVSRFFLRQ